MTNDQIPNRITIRVNEEPKSITLYANDPRYWYNLSKAWATQMGSKVKGEDYSSKQYADYAKIWAEGSDSDVEALGGEHSAKGWSFTVEARLSDQIRNHNIDETAHEFIQNLIREEATERQREDASLQTQINSKVDKVPGKTLTTNDFTNAYKNKLDGIETGAQVNTVTSVNGKIGDVVLNASDVGALPETTTIGDATFTIKQNGSTVGTFTANSVNNTEANITVPTKLSELDNTDTDFVNKSYVDDIDTNLQDQITANALAISDEATARQNADEAIIAQIPTVGSGTITVKQGNAVKGAFNLNQNGDYTLQLEATQTSGVVLSVNEVLPDENGNVELTAEDVDTYTKTEIDEKQRSFTFSELDITKTTHEYSTIDLAKEIVGLDLPMSAVLFGEVTLNDMPTGIGNAEMKVEVQQRNGDSSVLAFTLTSTNVEPHEWEFYWVGTSNSGAPSVTSWYATVRENMVLTKTNTTAYTPTGDYNPATKKYADEIIPSQAGNANKFLTTNGTAVSWASVDALPSQSGQSGKFLTTDGSSASWASALTSSDVVDNVTSTSTTQPLSANQGKVLQDQVTSLKGLGKFLSVWNCSTGLPVTDPADSPYPYKTGDYYIVGTVASSDGTNYKPDGSSYTTGVASTAIETSVVAVDDFYIYDGTNWKLLENSTRTVTFANIAGQPTDNSNLASALGDKVDANNAITGGTHTKITYDSKGLVTSGSDLTIDEILPAQTSQSGKFLTTDGTNASWASVDALPSQAGQSGKYLTTNGTAASWSDVTFPVTDVQINSTSILSSGVANIPYGTNAVAGLAKAGSGLASMANGTFYIYPATDAAIQAKTNTANPIVPSNLDYAVKVGVTTNINTLTTAEQTSARTWIGAGQTTAVFVDWSD